MALLLSAATTWLTICRCVLLAKSYFAGGACTRTSNLNLVTELMVALVHTHQNEKNEEEQELEGEDFA